MICVGEIANGVRRIEPSDDLWINFNGNRNDRAELVAIEHGDVRTVFISKAVAEILIAKGMDFSG